MAVYRVDEPGYQVHLPSIILHEPNFVCPTRHPEPSQRKGWERKGEMKDYLILSFCTAGGIYFTNK